MEMLRVLIIDDSPTARMVVRFALQRERELELVESTDGIDALRQMTESHFDLALVDINMPTLDGFSLIRMVRADPSLADTRLVVITSEGGETERSKALSLGADAYLTKPLRKDEVLSEVRKLLALP
jgi:two-component system chemotaxis response regulator CheY